MAAGRRHGKTSMCATRHDTTTLTMRSKRPADASERLIKPYLESLNLGGVEHQPLGNVTPDFSIDGRIAVEVRRLNQNFVDGIGDHQGVEQVHFSIYPWLHNELPKMGPSIEGESWWVSVHYRRPLPHSQAIRASIRNQLQAFMGRSARTSQSEWQIEAAPNFRLTLRLSSEDLGKFFVLASMSDYNQGGFVVAEALKNVELCSAEKWRKVIACPHKFEQWWLVLHDVMGLGLVNEDWVSVSEHLSPSCHVWNRIAVVGSKDPLRGHVLYTRQPV